MYDYTAHNYLVIDASNSDFEEIIEGNQFEFCINCNSSASIPDSLIHPFRDFYLYTVNVFKPFEAITKYIPKCKFLNISCAAGYGNYVFFQQFDSEMVKKMVDTLEINCEVKKEFMRYEITGWIFSDRQECNNAVSYNPHTGKGKGSDGAAHKRAICFIEAIRNLES